MKFVPTASFRQFFVKNEILRSLDVVVEMSLFCNCTSLRYS